MCLKIFQHIFALALTLSEMLTFKIVYLQKVDQGNRAQFSQCCPLMAHIEIDKSHPMHFSLALTISETLIFHIFYLQKV